MMVGLSVEVALAVVLVTRRCWRLRRARSRKLR